MVSRAGLVSAKTRARNAVPTILATTNTSRPSRPCPRAISQNASSLKGMRIAAGMRKATSAAQGGRPAMRASHQRTPGNLPSHAMQACMASHTPSSIKIHSAAETVNAPRRTATGRLLRFPFMSAEAAGSLARPDDLVQLHSLDVGVDLHPQRKVIGHLESKRGLFHAREQVVQAPGIEIDDPRLVREILRIPGAVQDLVVALVLGHVGP